MRIDIKDLPTLHEYGRAFGLQWDVEIVYDPRVQMCMCMSESGRKEHKVILNDDMLEFPDKYHHDLGHECAHLYLGEQLGTEWVDIRFCDKTIRFSRKQPLAFEGLAVQLRLAWAGMDVWIDRVRHQFCPELTEVDLLERESQLEVILKAEEMAAVIDTDVNVLIMLALHIALARKVDFSSRIFDRFQEVAPSRAPLLSEYLALLEVQPDLSFSREKDAQMLEDFVREAARILSYKIKPRLEFRSDVYVWRLV